MGRRTGPAMLPDYRLWRQPLEDGETTTIYAVRYPLSDTRVRVVHFPQPQRLDVWCRSAGDLVQAGPLLVADGAVAFDPGSDAEGFSAGLHQFDSDITQDRHPRAALGLCDDTIVAVACDGRRTNVDAGLSMGELAAIMVDLGARRAINLDGGGSTTLVHRGHLLNRPYSSQDQPAPETRSVVTALAIEPA